MGIKINTTRNTTQAYETLTELNRKMKSLQLSKRSKQKENVSDKIVIENKSTVVSPKNEIFKVIQKNIESAKDLLSIAEKELNSIKGLLAKVKIKTKEAVSENSNESAVQEIREIGKEIDSIIFNSEFSKTKMLMTGSNGISKDMKFYIGIESTDVLTIDYGKFIGGNYSVDSSLGGKAENIHQSVKSGLESILKADLKKIEIEDFEIVVHKALGSIGSSVNKLNKKNDSLSLTISNSNASISRLFDAESAIKHLNKTLSAIEDNSALAKLSQLNINLHKVLKLFNT